MYPKKHSDYFQTLYRTEQMMSRIALCGRCLYESDAVRLRILDLSSHSVNEIYLVFKDY